MTGGYVNRQYESNIIELLAITDLDPEFCESGEMGYHRGGRVASRKILGDIRRPPGCTRIQLDTKITCSTRR